jgi:hypothetical protein
MNFNYQYLVDVDTNSSQNSEIVNKFNKILEKTNFNSSYKNKLDSINSQYDEKRIPYDEMVKQIRWNTYYYKKYSQQSRILFFIIFICIIMLTLSKLRSAYFDEKAYSVIIGIILGIAFIYTFYGLWDIFIKDDKNFDEYDFSIYGKPSVNIDKLVPKDEVEITKKCKPKTPESINASFLNKYF